MTTRRAPSSPAPLSDEARGTRRLSTLLEVSQALSGTLNLKASLHRVLEILAERHTTVRGIVSLLHENEVRVEAADQCDAHVNSVRYKLGEGITGRVVDSGKPIVVPRVSKEPTFLRRAARRPELSRQELSFICVPITLNRRPIGALGVDFVFKPDREFDSLVKFLGVVASLIAQSVKTLNSQFFTSSAMPNSGF